MNLETNRLSYVRATPFRTQSTARSRMTEGPSRRGTPCPRQCSMATISLAVYLRAYTPKSAACSAPPPPLSLPRRVGKVSFHGAKRTFSRAQSSFSRTIRPPSCAPPSPNPSWPLCPPSPCPRPPVPAKRSRARQRLYAKHTIERARARARVGMLARKTRTHALGTSALGTPKNTTERVCVCMLACWHANTHKYACICERWWRGEEEGTVFAAPAVALTRASTVFLSAGFKPLNPCTSLASCAQSTGTLTLARV